MREVYSHKEMLHNLSVGTKNYVLLYKKGSDSSQCSYEAIKQASVQNNKIKVLSADVSHIQYDIKSVPALLVFEGDKFINNVKGCNDKGFYKSLFESALFSVKSSGEKKQKRVTVYSTPSCSWCTTLKKHLNRNGIQYREVDVSKDQKAAEAMVRKSGQQGVPQTDINGKMIVGFDKKKINALLEINN